MLEKIPASVGAALSSMRAGKARLAMREPAFANVERSLVITSAAFRNEQPLPAVFTADGTGISPPLAWTGVPPSARQLVLIVEDADSPTPSPLVHAIAFDLPLDRCELDAGELDPSRDRYAGHVAMGKSSSMRPTYLPPDPPTGHGVHCYYFQLFALDRRLALSTTPGRTEILRAMRGHVLALGALIGTYERR